MIRAAIGRHRHRLVPIAIQHPLTGPDQTNVLFRCSAGCNGPDAFASLPLHGQWTMADLDHRQILAEPPPLRPGPDDQFVLGIGDREYHYVLGRYADRVMAEHAGEEPGYAIITTDAPRRAWVLGQDHDWSEITPE